jgi:DMSO/TMAO reductase YedYZ molybdopterin-dependent catalytic subunit
MHRTRKSWLIMWLVFLTDPSATRTQEVSRANEPPGVLLRVEGDVPQRLELTGSDLAKMPRRTVRAKDHGGQDATFEGVPLIEVLKTAGAKFGTDLRGPALATYLLVEAADGYRVVFALPELDPASTDRVILLADRRDGKALSAKEGPLRIVVPDEKRQSRWVRQVVSLKIKRA